MRLMSPRSVIRTEFFLVLLVLAMLASTSYGAPPERKLRKPKPHPKLRLPAATRGDAAVLTLGARLPEVAEAYDLKPAQLISLLRADLSLAVDRRGRLHFTEEPVPEGAPEAAATGDLPPPGMATPTTANAFALHSLPGSKRTIYLDFRGRVLSNTAWNNEFRGGADIVAPPFDTDGNPGSFSESELGTIVKIWQRMAEDFAPFDVDVTTQLTDEGQLTRSSEEDEIFGMRVLLSPLSPVLGNYGGLAYVGVFDDIGDYYKPAIVMPERLSRSEKNMAEAASHEVGHTLGLSHDGTTTGSSYYQGGGTGETSWAPLMGAGYTKNLTQWSRGEYQFANNHENDLAIIQTLGLEERPDDHGDSRESATFLAAGSSFAVTGVIGLESDVDMFSFDTAAGEVSLLVSPASLGSNLDVLLQLFRADGSLVATNNGLTNLAAGLSLTLPAGRYFVAVQGTGKGLPTGSSGYSSYGSMGQYLLQGTLVDPSGSVPPVAIAQANPTTGPAPLLVRLNGADSFDQDGTLVQFAWNFGDGQGATGAEVTHTYSSTGQYQAELTVVDNSGFSRSAAVTITVTPPNLPPVARATANPVSGTVPLSVDFNGSGSSDPEGALGELRWDFGDGTGGTGPTPTHLYSIPGRYVAWLIVTDAGGLSASNAVNIEVLSPVHPPTARFTATPATGPAPLLSTLDATVSTAGDQPLAQFTWLFGDGDGDSGPVVNHTFAAEGAYDVTLVVTDAVGLTSTNTQRIVVSAPLIPVATGNLAPTPVASATPASGMTPLPVSFSSAGSLDPDGYIASFAWNFGDGTTGTGPAPLHTYLIPGDYVAVLTVTDDRGASRSTAVNVQALPDLRLRTQSITLVTGGTTTSQAVRATVRVTDASGNPLAGVTVKGSWSGQVTGTSSAVTDANGNAVMTSSRTSTNGSITFKITQLTASGRIYAPELNVVSSAKIRITGLPSS